jgi:hypothetical protein
VLSVFRRPEVTLYFHDRNVWIEPAGFWTRGGASTKFTIVPHVNQAM